MAVGAPALSGDERRAVEAVDDSGLVAAVRALVRVPSWLGMETPAQELVASLIDQAGLTLDTWEIDLPAVQSHAACSWEIERSEARGVVGSLLGRGTGRTLLLNGHVDVVPPGDEALWNHPPFGGVLHDGRVYGRGALDMKGPLMAGLFALKALKEADVDLAGTVHLLSVIGEEDGGIGTLATILRGYRGDGAIVMEPTNLTIAPAQAGCLNFRVRVRGRAAHGAVRREGVSAFEKLFDMHQAIVELEADRNQSTSIGPLFSGNPLPFPISVGIMEGGDWASSVPDHAMMAGRIGVRPDEDVAEARSRFEDAIAAAAIRDPFLREQPPQVEWWGGRFLSASTPVDHPLVLDLHSAVTSVAGKEPSLEGVPFGADAGLLQRVANTPAILFGAGDIRDAHRPNESVAVADLVTMARSLAVAAIRFCGERKP